jgi:hypothetical protein
VKVQTIAKDKGIAAMVGVMVALDAKHKHQLLWQQHRLHLRIINIVTYMKQTMVHAMMIIVVMDTELAKVVFVQEILDVQMIQHKQQLLLHQQHQTSTRFTQVFLNNTKRDVSSSNNTKSGSVQERTTSKLGYLIVTKACAQMSVEKVDILTRISDTKALIQPTNKWWTIHFKFISQNKMLPIPPQILPIQPQMLTIQQLLLHQQHQTSTRFTQVFLNNTKRDVSSSNNTKSGSVQERTTSKLGYLIVTKACAQMSVEKVDILTRISDTKALIQPTNKWWTIHFKFISQNKMLPIPPQILPIPPQMMLILPQQHLRLFHLHQQHLRLQLLQLHRLQLHLLQIQLHALLMAVPQIVPALNKIRIVG